MFSFVIPTKNGYDNQNVASNLNILLSSIREDLKYTYDKIVEDKKSQRLWKNIQKIQITTIGDLSSDTEHIEFDGNISQKLNLGVKNARNDYVVWIRDYMKLYPGYLYSWANFILNDRFHNLRLNTKLDIGMNIVLNKDGTRFRDWCSWSDPDLMPGEWVQQEKFCPNGIKYYGRPCLAPYNYNNTKHMYVSGGYFVASKKFLLDNPFDESLSLGQAEDIEFSLRVRDKWNYKMNIGAKIGLSKQKDVILPCMMN